MLNKILIVNGPNLNLTGQRQPSIYGNETLDEINEQIQMKCKEVGLFAFFCQSNHEGVLIDKIQEYSHTVKGIIMNGGAFTHYSYAIADAIACCGIPVIEVHLSNIYARETFRANSVFSTVCLGTITGFGKHSYFLAVDAFSKIILKENIYE